MNKRNYLMFIFCFIVIFVEFLFPQTTNIEQRFSDRYKGIESDEILSDSYASYNIINLDSFIVAKMNQYHVPGLAASIVKDGEIYWTGAFGFANIEDSVEVTDSTLFMLASTSKTVVGVALMQLWEKGLFELDDDINNYLPFEVHNPFFPDSIITIRMLLTHTSSINDNWNEMPYIIGDSPITERQYLEDYLVPGGAYYHTINYNNFRPGSTWKYSNVAVALAAYLVEEIAGSFSLHCQDSIFAPLNMHETSWFLAELDTTHIARPYNYSGGNYYPLAHYGYSGYPAGQLRTSTLQLSNFLAAFMQGGEINNIRILDSATISLMTTVQFSQIDATQGLIWYKLLLNSRWIWGHGGGDKGVGSAMFYSPAENVGVICLCNVNARAFLEVMVDALFNYDIPVSVNTNSDLTPTQFSLSQNYPNPFNPRTIIQYSISKQSNVTLKLFDVLGSEVTTLVNKEQSVGNYELEFDGKDLTSGIYFYRLQANDFVETKKMILLK